MTQFGFTHLLLPLRTYRSLFGTVLGVDWVWVCRGCVTRVSHFTHRQRYSLHPQHPTHNKVMHAQEDGFSWKIAQAQKLRYHLVLEAS